MMIRLAAAVLSLLLAVGMAANVPHRSFDGISANSPMAKSLLQHARRVEGEDNNNQEDMDYDFVAEYSLKFQGCHHVTQWNEDVDDDNDVRIKTKRLVRFRLCPTGSCQSDRSAGCTSKYGDYVVDMNTFVDAYLQAMEDDAEEICQETSDECSEQCGEDEDCMKTCFAGYDLSKCLGNDDQYGYDDGKIDPQDYTYCAQFDGFGRRRKLEEDIAYYIGPYCADQGGEIHLGLFTDDTCTTFASNGESNFYNTMGYELPYSDNSLISQRCMRCGDYDNGNNNNGGDGDGEDEEGAEVKEICQNVYEVSGKCETKMNVDYPNESACTYIEGIKIIREDGVIRTSQVKKSKAAAVCIGLFLTMAVLLAGYVMYLRTKLGRAKVNLSAAAGSTLT